MVQIKPMRALRPNPDLVQKIVSLPYDVMDQEEARQMAAGNPHSFLRIIRSDLEFEDDQDPYAAAVYARAKTNLEEFRQSGWLVRDEEPCFYVYRLNSGPIQQTGLVAASSIFDYQNDVIKKHEFTRPEKEQDRTTHIDVLGANTGPVFLMYKHQEQTGLADSMNRIADDETPVYDVSFEDGVRHRLYRVGPGAVQARLQSGFTALQATYIADGHHRAASAFKNGLKRSTERGGAASADWNHFLTVIFPDAELAILPYNRAVQDLNGHSAAELMAKIEVDFECQPGKAPITDAFSLNLFIGSEWFHLKAQTHTWQGKSAKDQLAVSILQNQVLAPLLDIQDPRTSDRIKFVGGIRGDVELERLVQSGQFAAAFSMPPVTAAQIIAIADAGDTMPPKSTWFEPKLRSGFVTHLLDE
ncbi:MAG: DUF1015 domain-containing protein [Leptospiraceae bacterium]|nr:DUF1015 domain-containing protein [Leptospiraceae bacterium]